MFEVIKEIFLNKKWATSQLVNIASLSVMKFLTLLLVILNFEKENILLFFAAIFIFKIIFLYKLKDFYLNHERIMVQTIGILIIIFFSGYLIFEEYDFAKIFILFSTLLLFIYHDLFIISGLTSLHFSIKDKSKELLIMATSGSLVLLITSLIMPILGVLSSINENSIIYSSMFFIFISLILYLKTTDKKIVVKKERRKNIKIPKFVKWQIVLSVSMAILNNLGRNFMIPLFILLFASRNGFSEDSFKFMGLLLGIVSLITVFSRLIKIENISSENLMLKSYILCVSTWMIFGLSFFLYEKELFNEYIVLFVVFISILLEEIIAKFWTSGYLGELKRNSDLNVTENNSSEDNYKYYFYIHNNISLIGTVIGFLVSYLLFKTTSIPLSLIMIGFGFFGLIISILFKFNKTP